MTNPPSGIPLTELLAHAHWLRLLARELVHGEAGAEDLVQDTWVAALERPPADTARGGAWLRRVARNLAARRRREHGRRSRREHAIARHEATFDATPLVERVEVGQQVAAAVIALAEPYRTVVLLRFYEEKSPAEIAEMLAVPVATVWTRLSRALAQLRESLDGSHGGDRGAWVLLVAPLGFGVRPVETAAAGVAGAAGTAGTGAGAGGAGWIGGGFGAALTMGGLVMAQKVAIVSIVVGLVALGVGIGIGRQVFMSPPPAPAEPMVAEKDYRALESEKNDLARKLAVANAEKEALARRESDLKAKVDSLTDDLAQAREVAQNTPEAPADDEAKALAVAFGEFGDLPALRDADWATLAGAKRAMDPDLVALLDALARGEQPPGDLMGRIMAENTKLVQFALSLSGKLPTNGGINGAFSHPITTANLLAASLELEGHALSDSQKEELHGLGEDYEEAWALRAAEYNEDTPKLERLLDELEMKSDFVGRMTGLLDPEQQAAMGPPELRGRPSFDVFSPAIMLAESAAPFIASSREDLRTKAVAATAKAIGIEADMIARSPAFDRWLETVDPMLAPASSDTAAYLYSYDAAITAGRAQVRAMEDLCRELSLSAEARAKLRANGFIMVPRIVTSASPSAPATGTGQ